MNTVQFADPQWLWLLLVPALLLGVWVRQVLVRRRDAVRLAAARRVPVRERLPILGDTVFSLCLIAATALLIVAAARPGVVISTVRTGGIDLVILLDGSASMHTRDVPGNRWQRSIRFLRTLGDSLRWDDDRIALTLFARIAAPQVRLTKDPNTFFFFLDNLQEKSPFPLEDDTSWDTNSELGVFWGLRVLEKDQEVRGKSRNAPLFVMISDGQSWSGEVEKSLKLARDRNVPVVTVGVGTLAGGRIPEPARPETPATLAAPPPAPVYSTLDRASLKQIANASGGEYLELDRDGDINIANHIIDLARRRVVALPPEPKMEDLYWRVLAAAGAFALAGALSLRERSALVLQLAGGGLTLAVLASLLE
ncbi:MAG: VWA domain-containing protein [Vicinamibacterales bacterium]